MLLLIKILSVIVTVVRIVIDLIKIGQFLNSQFPQIRTLPHRVQEAVAMQFRRIWEAVTRLPHRVRYAVTTLLNRIKAAFTIKRLVPVEKKIDPQERRRR